MDRQALKKRWLELTRETLPALARGRHWPVHLDHCFQRILLDNACEGRWTDHVQGRPAYACAEREMLERAIFLAEECIAERSDLAALNRRSLRWRGKL